MELSALNPPRLFWAEKWPFLGDSQKYPLQKQFLAGFTGTLEVRMSIA
jgi:hypothetical protein